MVLRTTPNCELVGTAIDSRGNTFLCTKVQFHLMGNSHDAVVDGCCLFVVEVRSI